VNYFHVDRAGRLKEGDVIRLEQPSTVAPAELKIHLDMLYPEGLTEHGKRYLLGIGLQQNDVNSAWREFSFDLVRREAYPDRPSRYQSMFAAETLADAIAFRRRFQGGNASAQIWLVKATGSFRANMELLSEPGTWLAISESAHAYWSGERGVAGELWEQILRPPVRVIESVA
jgi:hypothetical protein